MNHILTISIMLANALAVANALVPELNPILEYVQNGASVAAILALFLWREMKRSEHYEKLYNEERRLRLESERRITADKNRKNGE